MNERLRFRFWNKEAKKMFYQKNQYLSSFLRRIYREYGKTHPSQLNFQIEERLQQSTGLRDKKGKLIFGGDIVIWHDGQEDTGKSRIAKVNLFPSLHFEVIKCPVESVVGHKFCFGSFIWTDTEKYLEILGNIYENPELLTKKEK